MKLVVALVVALTLAPAASAMRWLEDPPPPTPPGHTITVPANITTEATGPTTAVPYAVTVTPGDETVTCDAGSSFPVGTTTVHCTAADADPQSFTVTVQDTTSPQLNLPGDMTVPATGASGNTASYTFAPTDAVGVTASGCTPASGPNFNVGANTVSCFAEDAAGHHVAGSFTVTAQDTQPPTITTPGHLTVPATGASGAAATYSVSASDAIAGTVPAICAPSSGSTFAIGDTTVGCAASDGNGNTAHASFTISVVDSTPPVVTAPRSKTVEADNAAGGHTTFSATATDDTAGSLAPTCSPSSGSLFGFGQTTVTCSASDGHGNTGSAQFSITVVDSTPPTLADPPDLTREATGPGGAAVSYGPVSATDTVDGTVGASCAPASGTTFALGDTTVTCNATDAHGNHAGPQTFKITVRDTTAPAFSGVQPQLTVEANGPTGSKVNFPVVTAVDLVDGPIPVVTCSPPTGSLFPLGATPVSCHATDGHGNIGTAVFQVKVVDTTPPTLAIPGPTTVYATTPTGIPETAPAFFAFRNAATADDIVDTHPTIGDNLGSFAEVGTHGVGFVARDASGNVTAKSTQLIVLPMPPPGTPALPSPPPAKLPSDVANLKTFPGNGFVRLTWGVVPGAARYLVYRSANGTRRLTADGHGQLVYHGTATTYTDRGLKNGVEYRYVVVAEDAAGNQSSGVAAAAMPRLNLLRSPKDGARLKQPPKLVWAPNAEAAYYNVQLYRGQAKILSTWPVGASVKLTRAWKYAGRRYTLTKGVYRWYVWPGFGNRAKVDYGELMGSSSFQMIR